MAVAPAVQPMPRDSFMRRPLHRSLVLLGAVPALMVACSLNPQPLPPGEQPDAAKTPGVGADATTPQGDGSGLVNGPDGAGGSSGGSGSSSSSSGGGGPRDSGPSPSDGAVDANDAGDSAADGGADGSSPDAPADAPPDGTSDGGAEEGG
jgi:hypothetical protein